MTQANLAQNEGGDATSANAEKGTRIVNYLCKAGTVCRPSANISMEVNGEVRMGQAESLNGPLDATVQAIAQIVPHDAVLESFRAKAKSFGSSSEAEVTVCLRSGKKRVKSVSTHTDTNFAFARAYVGALKQLRIID